MFAAPHCHFMLGLVVNKVLFLWTVSVISVARCLIYKRYRGLTIRL